MLKGTCLADFQVLASQTVRRTLPGGPSCFLLLAFGPTQLLLEAIAICPPGLLVRGPLAGRVGVVGWIGCRLDRLSDVCACAQLVLQVMGTCDVLGLLAPAADNQLLRWCACRLL